MAKRMCAVDGCARPHDSHGFCGMHWQRVLRSGAPGGSEPTRLLLPEGTPCAVEGCGRALRARGLCHMHYRREVESGERGCAAPLRNYPAEGAACEVDGCEGRPKSRGLCARHYWAFRVYGDPTGRPAGEPFRYQVTCIDCGLEWEYARSSPGKQPRRCRNCRRAHRNGYVRRYDAASPREARERRARWVEKYPDRMNAARLAWAEAHPEQVRAISRAAKRRHPEANRSYVRARKVRMKRLATGSFSPTELLQRLAYYGNRCWMCSAPATCIDHVKPISKGGGHLLCNLRPACRRCNSSKGAQWPLPSWCLGGAGARGGNEPSPGSLSATA